MSAQDTHSRLVSPHDLGSELCRYRLKPLPLPLPTSISARWITYLVFYSWLSFMLFVGAGFMMALLLLFAGPRPGPLDPPLWVNPIWGPIYLACFGILAFASFGWPRFVYLAIHENGFTYRGFFRRHTILFSEITRCFLVEKIGLTVALRNNTRLRYPNLGMEFSQECLNVLYGRIFEHLFARKQKGSDPEGDNASWLSLFQDETVATQEKLLEISVPNTLWSYSALIGPLLIFIFLIAPAIFVTVSLFAFPMDMQGKISCWLFLLFVGLWLGAIGYGTWKDYERKEKYRSFRTDFLSFFARRHFLESMPASDGSVEIRYGFQLFGRRYYFANLPLNKIEEVCWSHGQGPKIWTLWIKCDHPDLRYGLLAIGPSRSVEKTDALGLAVVDFLRRAGLNLVEGKDEATYVQAAFAAKE